MIDVRRMRPLDIALWALGIAAVALAVFLGWSMWSHNRAVTSSTSTSRAVSEIEAALKKSPNDLNLRMSLAQALVVSGREDEAVEQYKTILKAKKEYTPALSGLGFLEMKKRNWKEGEKYFREVVDLLAGTQDADRSKALEIAYFYLGTALMEQRKYEEAVPYFKAALRIRRDAADTHYALAYTYRQLDSMKKYREELEAALAFDPKMPEPNYDLGLLLLEEGDIGRASELFRMSTDNAEGVEEPRAELDKLGPFSTRIEAARKYESTDTSKALAEARVAVALEPKNVDALRLLASLWDKAGNREEAAAAYRQVLVVVPADPDATKALERLQNDT